MSCKEQALNIVKINSLNFKQAAKWFLIHEKNRHFDDIIQIDNDLKKLTDVDIPDEALKLINCRFEISEGVTNTEREAINANITKPV